MLFRRQAVHHLGASAERGHRIAAGDHLAQNREVGPDAVFVLDAAHPGAEAGDNLVEGEQNSVPARRHPPPTTPPPGPTTAGAPSLVFFSTSPPVALILLNGRITVRFSTTS